MAICSTCKVEVPRKHMQQHTLGIRHRAAALTYNLYEQGLRPLPTGNTLPEFVPRRIELTRGVYEGEPRAELPLCREPVQQEWVARWIDIIVELWTGPIDLKGEVAKRQRDIVLSALLTVSEQRHRAICDAFDSGGLKAVREHLAPITFGEAPILIEEFERGIEALRRG